MGTDIHMHVEARDHEGAPWRSVDTWETETDGYLSVKDRVWSDRSYDTFAILAGVRNGVGFAGVTTGSGFVPIAEPRGLPDDMSPEMVRASEHCDHTPSWLTVAEMLQYNWTRTSIKSGIVGVRELARWKLCGRPESWSGMISGPGISIFEGEDAVRVIDVVITNAKKANVPTRNGGWWDLYHSSRDDAFGDNGIERDKAPVADLVDIALRLKFKCERPHFRVSWKVTYYDAASSFLSHCMPQLWRHGAPENVRIVFWFDS